MDGGPLPCLFSMVGQRGCFLGPLTHVSEGEGAVEGQRRAEGGVVRKGLLLLLFIPVLAMAGGQVWNEACAKPPATVLPGIVVDMGAGVPPAPLARRPIPPLPPSGVHRR